MPELTYPTPLHSSTYDTGPVILKYLRRAKDWASVTVTSIYEDKGQDFNVSADDCPIIWELNYDGLTDEDANILDQFWDAHGIARSFIFIEPRDHPWTFTEGTTYTGCHFVSFDKDHADVNGVKYIQKRKVVIAKYPT
jgi:hypothetical protein